MGVGVGVKDRELLVFRAATAWKTNRRTILDVYDVYGEENKNPSKGEKNNGVIV